ncbi:leucine-rich repeat-containing DDB_G0290503 isoform X2 [Paramuricea clavata]|uniref:Leucine-rich repeat-containing DDB_G0290503 isoform X2 n=1 Tax=Paramuricea clavata TaxID=317549 RepID=A0A6S7HVU8_PARCT|nr:leucine-rich repeat-containing DDB_G0290503 isoform X2 [Paramuricea clavata]
MLAASSNAGLYRRLNKNERLRDAAGKSSSSSLQGSSSSKKEKPLRSSEKKPFEFALLRAPEVDSDGEEEDSLRKDNVINRGIITLTPSNTEKLIRDNIVSSLKPRYPMIENRDFEFVKVVQKKFMFLSWEKEHKLPSPFNSPTTSPDLTGAPSDCNLVPDGPSVRETPLDSEQFTLSPQGVQQFGPAIPEMELSPFFSTVIDGIPSTVSDPTEMLRFLQKKILLGRDLDISDVSSELNGDTNYISVDRDNILETTFSELNDGKNPRITFEVQFYGEQAEDRGSPRKEWIRLCNQKIHPKYFEHGLKARRKGLDTLRIHTVGRKFPQFLHLFRPSENAKLSVKRLLHLLIPTFSEKRSNSLKYGKSAYTHFVKYVREVASGRRVTKLENILEFATCASEEPLLGFALSTSIEFVETTCASREPSYNSDERAPQNQV